MLGHSVFVFRDLSMIFSGNSRALFLPNRISNSRVLTGITTDKSILEHVIYDPDDQEMTELLKPSIDEAFIIQEENVRRIVLSSK